MELRQDYEALVNIFCNILIEEVAKMDNDTLREVFAGEDIEEIKKLPNDELQPWEGKILSKSPQGRELKSRTQGDIVDIRPKALVELDHAKGGRPWGRLERANFLIVVLKGLTEEEAIALKQPIGLYVEAGEIEGGYTGRIDFVSCRFVLDINEALSQKAPYVLTDDKRKADLFKRDDYDANEQPLQQGECCLEHVTDISGRSDIEQQRALIEQAILENDNGATISPIPETVVEGVNGISLEE
jgi:hypothetical protein